MQHANLLLAIFLNYSILKTDNTLFSNRRFAKGVVSDNELIIPPMTYTQARRQRGGRGGNAPPIYFLPPTVFFWKEEVAFLGRKKRWNLWFPSEKAFGLRRRPFFFLLEITWFWPENLRFRPEKAFGFRRRPFFWRSPAFGRKKR